jgi:hypothetical protein
VQAVAGVVGTLVDAAVADALAGGSPGLCERLLVLSSGLVDGRRVDFGDAAFASFRDADVRAFGLAARQHRLPAVLGAVVGLDGVLGDDADDPAVADEVNANFDAAETAVDDNNQRLNAAEGTLSDHEGRLSTLEGESGVLTRSIPLPVRSFWVYDGAGLISDDQYGLQWDSGTGSTLQAALPAPADYAGGDLTLRVLFETEGSTPSGGVVEFFSRATSYSDGESATTSVSGLSDDGVTVGSSGSLAYVQSITIPASRMEGDFWYIRLSRSATGATYTAPVVLHGVALDYPANR